MTDPKARFALLAGALALAAAVRGDSFVVSGGRIADGTGGAVKKADVRVDGDRIVAVGRLKPKRKERVIHAEGLVLAPGFIDIHNHSTRGLASDPLAETQVSQGVTLFAVGAYGSSPWPLSDYLAERRLAPAAVNVLAFVGHATVRRRVMGEDYKRAATPEEISRMADLVAQGMREGAAGLSSGLEYEVGSYSTTEELVAMARAASHGGIYMTHIRDEADESFKSFAEALDIGRRAGIPVQISHIKLGTVGVWGQAGKAVDLFARARASGQDVTADCYPYEAWHANIEVLVPNKKYDDPASIEKALADVGGASRVTISGCEAHPEYVNKNIDEIARAQSVSPVEIFRRIVRDGGADVIGHSMKAEDVAVFLRQPWVMIASDGGINSEHPRGAGTFPRVLGRYVREQHLFSLAEAIRKMTLLPARRLGLEDRGRIAPGRKADLVLFDPGTVVDQSTFAEPQRLSLGIRAVWVNGQQVWSGGQSTGATPGRVLSKGGPPESSEERQRLDAVFQAYARPDSPGCAVAVVRDGRVEQERGYGMASLEHGVPITPDTVFDIGSAAKQFAAASVLLLAQDHKLLLDDDIRRYVPELPDFGTPIRLVNLLHHTSGLRDYTDLLSLAGARSEDLTTDRDALDILSRQKALDFPPGTAYRYSNSGYFLLSVVVRRVTGKPLRDFARERIFVPLGMTSTQYMDEHGRIIARRATGYAKRGETGFRVAMSDWEQNGDGGLQTTVRDLARWDANFEKPVVGGEGMIAELTRPGTLLGGKPMDYALGLRVDTDRGIKRIRHGGSWVGYRAEFLRYPDRRLSVIVLCNLRSAAPSRLARAVAQIYLPELAGPADADGRERRAEGQIPPQAEPASSPTGLYWNADRFEIRRIRESGGKLFYATAPGEETALLPIAPGRFGTPGSSREIRVSSEGAAGSSATVVEQGPDEPPATWKMVSALATIPATELAPYRGSYACDELDATYRIVFEKDHLVLNRRGADPTALEPLFRDAFHAPDIGVVFFDRGPSGAIGGFRIALGPSRLAFKRSSP